MKINNSIEEMTDEEIREHCHFILGLPSYYTTRQEFIGFMIEKFREWNCCVAIDLNGMVYVTVLNIPEDYKIKVPSLQTAFLKTAQVKGKWTPVVPVVPVEEPKAKKSKPRRSKVKTK